MKISTCSYNRKCLFYDLWTLYFFFQILMFFSKTTVAIATKLLVNINYNPKIVKYCFYEYSKGGPHLLPVKVFPLTSEPNKIDLWNFAISRPMYSCNISSLFDDYKCPFRSILICCTPFIVVQIEPLPLIALLHFTLYRDQTVQTVCIYLDVSTSIYEPVSIFSHER